jgi:type I restriction enzyme M protein
MINKDNFKALLIHLGFEEKGNIFTKNFDSGCYLGADFKKEELQYPESDGLTINERQTCNFSSAENAVVFECVHKLLEKGYKPEHIELEPKWKLGHGASGGRADILVKDQKENPLLIIECKTYGKEFSKAWKETLDDGGQLFSYAQQIAETEFLCLYASEYDAKQSQLLIDQRIISHKDNEKIIELDEGLKAFSKASNVKNRYEVWKETYQLEYTETGIFEENIQPYQIGKSHYTLDIDTRAVTEQDKEGKYHRFRTILRQHNIARRETAFEVLVNLFLAKIVDEEENKNNLEFYWKGVAYDNYYDFIDRLQRLYQIGMRKFLKDEVMYISSDQIDDAFWTVKNKKNATKKQIQKYFRDLKFFSNNAFSLINVHNERLFNRNTKVLVELVQMWQGLRLKTTGQNQFLGDMFEYFLDNSIKQSEGQFFTPMPITKFIVASLPLEHKIQQSTEPLKAIDYACGAGHFLTEYAHQIDPIVKKHKQTDISHYHENIIGIEKEDRLAKIAKVSAYMYGQDAIKIIEEDALSQIDEINPANFDVLVANPPFAVEGFLLNLTDKQKETYELINTTELNSNTNNIQCFFLERAKQIMAGSGVVGVIVPSSILSNSDGTHIATREVIVKYFDIIALVELGSGTFGKTGTNTVVLFLRRKDKKPEPAEHYKNRVDDYFSNNLNEQLQGKARLDNDISEYQDIGLIKAYCQHNELPFDEYIKLFNLTADTINHIDELLKTELFSEYKKEFENSTDIKNLKKKRAFKDKTNQEKELELNKRLINSLYAIEKDKLYYFILAYENPQKVLIVKSPSNNKEQKKFLGYEWSGAKGQEGIKYFGGSTVNDIITPLFNPKELGDASKINSLIQQNFLGNSPDDLSDFEEYKELISYANVQDILDFSRTDFNKAFSLTPKKSVVIESKWELVRLGDIVDRNNFVNGYAFKSLDLKNKKSKESDLPVLKIGNIDKLRSVVSFESDCQYHSIVDVANKIIDKGYLAIALTGATVGKSGWVKEKCLINQRVLSIKSDKLKVKYAAIFILSNLFYDYAQSFAHGNAQGNLSPDQVSDFKIPLPPKEVQEQIVAECETIDQAVAQALETIEQAKNDIEDVVSNHQKGEAKLSDILDKVSDTVDPTKETGQVNYIGLENIESNTGMLVGSKNSTYAEIKSNKNSYQTDDILYGKLRPNLNKVYLAEDKGICSTDILVFRAKKPELSKYYKYYLLSKKFNSQVLKTVSGQQLPRTSWDKIKNIAIPTPPLSEQNKLVSTIEKLELKIIQAQKTIDTAPKQKQAILDKHLK